MSFDPALTERAARILACRDPAPGDRLDAFLMLAGQELLWRRDGPGANFAEAVRRYETDAGKALARVPRPPSFGVVRWCRILRCHEVAVWLAGRRLGDLLSRDRRRYEARDWRAEDRLLVTLGVSHDVARNEPPRRLDDAERRVTELALVSLVHPDFADCVRTAAP